jgi:hypothetical protein
MSRFVMQHFLVLLADFVPDAAKPRRTIPNLAFYQSSAPASASSQARRVAYGAAESLHPGRHGAAQVSQISGRYA